MTRIFIDDAGAFGTAMAAIIAGVGYHVDARVNPAIGKQHCEMLLSFLRVGKNQFGLRENNIHLPGVELPGNIRFTGSYDGILSADAVFIAVPGKYLEKEYAKIKPYLEKNKKCAVVVLTKGINHLNIFLNQPNVAVLSGYTPAMELAVSERTKKYFAASLASKNLSVIRKVKNIFKGTRLGILGTTDVAGVSMGGALKNAYAIGYGVVSGVCSGDIAYSYLRYAHEEMKIFLNYAGASEKTWSSPAVQGDFYLTSIGEINWKSRNVAFGEFLSKFQKKHNKNDSDNAIEAYLKANTVEGYEAMLALCAAAEKHKLSAPLLFTIRAICEFGASPTCLEGTIERIIKCTPVV